MKYFYKCQYICYKNRNFIKYSANFEIIIDKIEGLGEDDLARNGYRFVFDEVMMELGSHSRRSALKHIGVLMASVAGREFFATWFPSSTVMAADTSDLQGMRHGVVATTSATPYLPQFFKPQEFRNIGILTEMIIPRDDKPGAKDARVADYIDFLVFSSSEFEPGMQKDWADGLTVLERHSQKEFGLAFAEISDEQRHSLLTAMSLPETNPDAHHEGYAFFRLVKETTVEGFYTSRIGLMNALEYKGLSFLMAFPGCTHPEHQN